MEEKRSVLIIDDDTTVSSSLRLNLELANYRASEVNNPKAALELARNEEFDVVICDLRMPEMDGLSFIAKFKDQQPKANLVLMTAFGNHDLALQAIRVGAADFISKPFTFEELIFTLKKVEERENLRNENESLRSLITQKYNLSNIVAHSKCMHSIFETVKRLSQFNTTVLITGESGTGKELLARAIHHNSPRRGRPFVAINCGAIPENLMESELFGHKRGSFTDATRDKKGLFEEASGGTIFLDEIGEMPLHLQVKLLRALQEQAIRRVGDDEMISVDVRVIAATLRDLEKDARDGRFRDDLYYRLNVVTIHIPALRERQEDIPVLVEHFLKKHAKRLGLAPKPVSSDAMKCILAHGWKGNVRELENCIERALVLSDNDEIEVEALPRPIQLASPGAAQNLSVNLDFDESLSIKKYTETLERTLIVKALKKTKGNRTHAAKLLEISHRALLYKLKEYEIDA